MQQKVVPVVFNAGALGSEMSVADDDDTESALKIAPSPFAGKPAPTTWDKTTDRQNIRLYFAKK